ncbi:hypothetical protein [Clostridium sp. YIM B02500]|nr:hypothetical protein [Clostridium sp. YIM B02500]
MLQNAMNSMITGFRGLITGKCRIWCRNGKRSEKRIKKAVLQGI